MTPEGGGSDRRDGHAFPVEASPNACSLIKRTKRNTGSKVASRGRGCEGKRAGDLFKGEEKRKGAKPTGNEPEHDIQENSEKQRTKDVQATCEQ